MKKISRIGAYGILLRKNKIALVNKMKGPYKGLLDLPGGAIEFGESPLDALKREIKEELALKSTNMVLYNIYSHLGIYKEDVSFEFHHIGIIYQVNVFHSIPNAIAEDSWDWYVKDNLSHDLLTPFAKRVIFI